MLDTLMETILADPRCLLLRADALDALRILQDDSVDSLVTDPPAGISFMGKGWDGDKGGRDETAKRFWPAVGAGGPRPDGRHRAMSDIRGSIATYSYYLASVGPDSVDADEIARMAFELQCAHDRAVRAEGEAVELRRRLSDNPNWTPEEHAQREAAFRQLEAILPEKREQFGFCNTCHEPGRRDDGSCARCGAGS